MDAMESLIPKSKTGKALTSGSLMLAMLYYLVELRVSVGNIDARLSVIEKTIQDNKRDEDFKKILSNHRYLSTEE